MKTKDPIYVDGSGLTKNQKNKNEDKSMNNPPKTTYTRPLVPNAEGLDETTNPHFKNTLAPYFTKSEAEFVLA